MILKSRRERNLEDWQVSCSKAGCAPIETETIRVLFRCFADMRLEDAVKMVRRSVNSAAELGQ